MIFEINYSTATETWKTFQIEADFEQDALDAFYYEVQQDDESAEVISIVPIDIY